MNYNIVKNLGVDEKINFLNKQQLFKDKNYQKNYIMMMVPWVEAYGLDFLIDNEHRIEKDAFIPIYSMNWLVEAVLEKFPSHEKYTRKLISYGYCTYQPKIMQFLNQSVLDDKDFILDCFTKKDFRSFSLYEHLSKRLKHDADICHFVEEKQYYIQVLNSKVKTIEDFHDYVSRHKNSSEGCLDIMIEKAKSVGFILENDDSILRFFKIINNFQIRSELDAMSDPQVSDHCMRILLVDLGEKSELIRRFWETDLGKQIDDYNINSYSNYMKFDDSIVPEIYPVLVSLMKFNELEKKLNKSPAIESILKKI